MIRLVALLLLLGAPPAASAFDMPRTREVRLPNGALVIMAEKHDVPLIAFRALLRGGAIADAPGKEGVASITGGLLRKGAGKRTAQEIAALVDGLGAELDTGAGLELSYVTGEFMSRDQAVMLDILADVLRRPTFPAEEFEKLKKQTIDGITADKDDPRNVIGEYGYTFLYGDHPYGRPVDGDEATNRELVRDDALRYYHENYGGDRLILSMVGDFSAPAMEAKIRAKLSDWAKAPGPAPQAPPASRRTGRRVLLVDKPDATQTYFWMGTIGVTRTDPDRLPLDIANTAYGGRFTSILNTALRLEGGLTYGAAIRGPRYSQAGPLAIISYTKTETTGKAVDLALKTLESVRTAGIDSTTLISTKTYMVGQFPPRLETEDQIASALADLAFYGLGKEELEHYTDRVVAARPEDVKRAITRIYPPAEDITYVFVGNAAAIRGVVKKYGPVTEVPITDPMLSIRAGGGASRGPRPARRGPGRIRSGRSRSGARPPPTARGSPIAPG
jgi:zinc protease